MKFNLKNRPRATQGSLEVVVLRRYHHDALEWFEGFEKELRETMAKEVPKLRYLTVVYIKEILGE